MFDFYPIPHWYQTNSTRVEYLPSHTIFCKHRYLSQFLKMCSYVSSRNSPFPFCSFCKYFRLTDLRMLLCDASSLRYIRPCILSTFSWPKNLWALNISFYYMAFQNSLFWLVDKRSVKTHIRTVVRIFRIWTGVPDVVYLAGNFCNQIVFDWACMPTVYCYPVKLTIADLIRAKSICSQTQFSNIINWLLTSLVRSVLWNIRPLFFAWTSLLRRSVHTKKPRSDISQYRPHAWSISR
jgi:hypothetical protein